MNWLERFRGWVARSRPALLSIAVAACGGSEADEGSGSDATSNVTSSATGDVTGADATETAGTGAVTGGVVDCELAAGAALTLVWDFSPAGTNDGGGPFARAPGGDIYVAGATNAQELDNAIWLRRLTPDGAEVWTATEVAPSRSLVSAVAVASSGPGYAVGTSLIEDPSFGLTSTLFVGAFDLDGQVQWTDDTPTDPPNPFTQGEAAVVASNGDLLIGGPAGSGGGYLRRYDPSGAIAWTVATDAGVAALAIASDDALYVATADGVGSLLERRDDAGAVVWSVPGPGVADANYFGSSATGVAVASDGGPVFIGTIDYLVGNPMMPTDSWSTLWVQRLDSAGVASWTTTFDHVGYPQMSVAVHPDDRVTVANREMDETVLVRRLDAAGTETWTDILPCPGGGWRMAPIDDDLLVSGTLTGAGQSSAAFVGRFAG